MSKRKNPRKSLEVAVRAEKSEAERKLFTPRTDFQRAKEKKVRGAYQPKAKQPGNCQLQRKRAPADKRCPTILLRCDSETLCDARRHEGTCADDSENILVMLVEWNGTDGVEKSGFCGARIQRAQQISGCVGQKGVMVSPSQVFTCQSHKR